MKTEKSDKHFYAACAAMQGLIASNPQCLQGNIDIPIPSKVAKLALEYADELLKQYCNDNSDGKWVCQKCGELVDGRNVTSDEYHEGCGGRCI